MPDRAVASQSYAPWLPCHRAEQILARLVLATDGLRYHQLEAIGFCWVFERLRFRLRVREDGLCLLLIEQNQPGLSSAPGQNVLEDFARLRAGEPGISQEPVVERSGCGAEFGLE